MVARDAHSQKWLCHDFPELRKKCLYDSLPILSAADRGTSSSLEQRSH